MAAYASHLRSLKIDTSREHVLSLYRQLLKHANRLPTNTQRSFTRSKIRRRYREKMHLEHGSEEHIMYVRVAMGHIDDITAKVEHLTKEVGMRDDRMSEEDMRRVQEEEKRMKLEEHKREVMRQSFESWKEADVDEAERQQTQRAVQEQIRRDVDKERRRSREEGVDKAERLHEYMAQMRSGMLESEYDEWEREMGDRSADMSVEEMAEWVEQWREQKKRQREEQMLRGEQGKLEKGSSLESLLHDAKRANKDSSNRSSAAGGGDSAAGSKKKKK